MYHYSTMAIIVVVVVTCLARLSDATCNSAEEEAFKRTLEPECRENLALGSDHLTDPSLLDSICTSSCLGRYAQWLRQTCHNDNKAWFLRAACLKQVDKEENKRCRLFFPDKVNISTTRQCAALFRNDLTCGLDCRDPLQGLVDQLGCCFLTIYNNTNVIDGIWEQRLLTGIEYNALKDFQNFNVLSRCITNSPQTCSGSPFPAVSLSSTAGTISGSLLIIAVVGYIVHQLV